MNLKKTIFGLGAATMLSLSMMSGAMAAEGDSQTDTKLNADLLKNICSVSGSSSTVTFGPWKFDGVNGYVLEDGAKDNGAVWWNMTTPGPNQTCPVSLSVFNGGNLSNGAGDKLSAQYLTVSIYDVGPIGNLAGKKTVQLAPKTSGAHTGQAGGAFTLNPPATAAPGAYTGTLRIETSNAG